MFTYPELHVGDDVSFAVEPTVSQGQWRLGKVITVKNQSCDIAIYSLNGLEIRTDCWHSDDPRCETDRHTIRMPGRGVFRLAHCEEDKRRMFARMDVLERKIAMIERSLEARAVEQVAQKQQYQPKPQMQGTK